MVDVVGFDEEAHVVHFDLMEASAVVLEVTERRHVRAEVVVRRERLHTNVRQTHRHVQRRLPRLQR